MYQPVGRVSFVVPVFPRVSKFSVMVEPRLVRDTVSAPVSARAIKTIREMDKTRESGNSRVSNEKRLVGCEESA